MRAVRWAAAGVLSLIGLITIIAAIVGVVENALSHEEDGGRARVHSPFLARPCSTPDDPECAPQDRSVKLTLRTRETEDVADDALYRRALRQGPFFVEVKWRSDSHEVTQVREDGEWRVVAHPSDADFFFAFVMIVVGVLRLLIALRVTPI